MKEYTARVEGFQIRDVHYFGPPPENAPIQFDIVKWYQTEPTEVTEIYQDKRGKYRSRKKISTEFCFSVGCLVWNAHEPCFEFESVGLRWLEENPSQAVVDMIIGFCARKEKEINDE